MGALCSIFALEDLLAADSQQCRASSLCGDRDARVDPCVCEWPSLGLIGTGGPSRTHARPDRGWCRTARRIGVRRLRVGLASRALAGPLGLLALALRSLWPCSPWSHQPRTSLRRLARSDRRLGQSIEGRPRRLWLMIPSAVKTATERAAEAIEAVEKGHCQLSGPRAPFCGPARLERAEQ